MDHQIATMSRNGDQVLAGSHPLAEQTEAALRTRMLIGQAVGILMQRDGVCSDAAFSQLVTVSQRTNTKLREVARQLVERLDESNRPH